MHRINIPWKQVIENSAAKARSLNRLRVTTCCIGISGALQVTSRMSKLSTSPQTDNVWIFNAGSMALFGYLIVTEKVHQLITSFIFGTQIFISNVYIKEKPLLENRNGIPDQQVISSEEDQRELIQDHQASHEVLSTLIDQQEDSRISIETLPMETNRDVREYKTEEPIYHTIDISTPFVSERPISTSIVPQENRNKRLGCQIDQQGESNSQELSIGSELDQIQDNLKEISELQTQDQRRINECIDNCKHCLGRLHEADKQHHNGFNPSNTLAKKLRLIWVHFINLLPTSSQKEAFCCAIEELSRCNYIIPEPLQGNVLDKTRQRSVTEWVEENHKYFEAKSRIFIMTTDKQQKCEEKFLEKLAKEKTSKSYTTIRKQELMNTYLLRNRQLQVANLNEIIEKHKTWYSMIFLEDIDYYKKHREFLTRHGFPE